MSDPKKPDQPEVIGVGLCACCVCVPQDWTNGQAEDLANRASPTGISSRWTVRTQEAWDKLVTDGVGPDKAKAVERVSCDGRPGYVHIVLEC